MRCRHFTLRLTAQHAKEDEARLNEFLQSVQVHTVQTTVGAPGHWSILVFYEEPARQGARRVRGGGDRPGGERPGGDRPGGEAGLTPEQLHVYERLREWRSRRAATEGKPAYVIAHNAVLMHIARHHMSIRAAEDLLGIGQFGEARAARYGPDILQLLAAQGARDETPLFDDER